MLQRLDQGGLVHHQTPGDVDEAALGAQRVEDLSVDLALKAPSRTIVGRISSR